MKLLLKTIITTAALTTSLTVLADNLANQKMKVFEALKKNGVVIASTYQANSDKKNNISTLLTNAGIVHVNYETQSLFIDNDIIHIDEKGNFVSGNARVISQFLDDLEYKIVAKSENEKYRIQVFISTSCSYCKAFFKTVPLLNKEGISVEFILTSNSGDKSVEFKQMSAIQSQPNQLQALTNQMNGIIPTKLPDEASVQIALHQQAAIIVGLKGTPTVYYKGLKLPAVTTEKYPELLKGVDESVSINKEEYGAHRVN